MSEKKPKEKIEIKKTDEVLLKPNVLIKGVLEVNSNEYKAFNLILQRTQLDLQKNIDATLIPVNIPLEDFQEIYRDANKNSLKKIGNSLEKLQKSLITWNEGKNIITGTLVNRVELIKTNMSIKCYMDAKVVRVLKDYKKGYSPINLKLTKKANGFYTQRLYEIFRSWSNKEEPEEITIDELKKVLCLEGKSYNLYANIKNRVLEPAIAEIKEKLNMKVDYTEIIGARRKVIALKFTVEDEEPRHYTFRKKSKKITTKKEAPKIIEEKQEAPEKIKFENNIKKDNDIEIQLKILNMLHDVEATNITETHVEKFVDKFGNKIVFEVANNIVNDIIFAQLKLENIVQEFIKRATKLQEATATEAPEEVKEAPEASKKEENKLDSIEKNVGKSRNFDVYIEDIARSLKINNIAIDAIELAKLKEKYGEIMLDNAVNILISANAQRKISTPLKYLIATLENIKNNNASATKASNSNSSKPSTFANFTQRQYDYDKLEKQLLGWDDDEDEDDE